MSMWKRLHVILHHRVCIVSWLDLATRSLACSLWIAVSTMRPCECLFVDACVYVLGMQPRDDLEIGRGMSCRFTCHNWSKVLHQNRKQELQLLPRGHGRLSK